MGGIEDMRAAGMLKALADDWNYAFDDLYGNLKQGTEGRWGVDEDHEGSVSGTLRMIADRVYEELGGLRFFACRVHDMLWGDGWHPLDETADRLEEELAELDRTRCHESEEHAELDDSGCYDGMVHPVDDEDYASVLWVRDHGGLDAVRDRLERVETWDADKAALWEMCAECGGVDGVRARMMPEGVEWPRYEDGEPVQIGGEFMGKDGKTYTAKQIQFIGKCFSLYDFCDRKPQFNGFYGERVKRPAVLAADGELLEVGQTVWRITDGMPATVERLNGATGFIDSDGTPFEARYFTHQRPVLDADGVPIKKGDTVYEDGEKYTPFTVLRLPTDQYRLVKVEYPNGSFTYLDPERITHAKPEPPDSWKRIEEDKGLNPFDYCKKVGHKLWTFDNAEEFKASDLVRRCRALAERGE